ncbi:MAG TPA: MFS transporter [Deltaproteobacteria bacterium]|nr:MFS transporter [Deltaproteobacteria bacterium]|tara:strand:- start:3005 stop:4366 length:1362 start_codon:yes stop_codon:yes gene_type:complete
MIPTTTRIGYSIAETGINAVETLLRLYLLIFYTDAVGLAPGWAGLAVALGLCWDAVTDPLMGYLSDRWYSCLGGRRPFLLLGGLLLGISIYILFSPPSLETTATKFTYLLAGFLFLNTAMTILSVPHMAIAAEITVEPDERSTLFAIRFACGNIGAIFGAGLPGFFASGERLQPIEQRLAMNEMSIWLALVVWGTAGWAWAAIAKQPMHRAATHIELRQSLVQIWRNSAFRPLLLAYVVATFGVAINGALALYYYRYRLLLEEQAVQLILVVFMLILTLSLVGWVLLSRKLGKLRPLLLGVSLLGFFSCVTYPFFPPGNFWVPLLVGGVLLGSCVGSVVLLDSLLTDVIDYDQVRTGIQRSGVYFGVWRLGAKIARALAVAGAGLVLEVIGFTPNTVQSAEVSEALAWLFGPGVGVFLVLAALLLWQYRFDDAKQRQVRRILQRKEVLAAQAS